MKNKLVAIAVSVALAACVTVPPNTFTVSPQQIEQRQVETRKYEGISETDILIASSNVLQDLGFNLENSESKLGVLTANKQRDATNAGEVVAAIFIAALGGGVMAISKDQSIRVSLVVRPVLDSDGNVEEKSHLVRASFQRVVHKTDNSAFAETLNDNELFTDFFDRLSKSVFFEGQKI